MTVVGYVASGRTTIGRALANCADVTLADDLFRPDSADGSSRARVTVIHGNPRRGEVERRVAQAVSRRVIAQPDAIVSCQGGEVLEFVLL